MSAKLLNGIKIVEDKEIVHNDASEKYVHVIFYYSSYHTTWDGFVPIEYKKTGTSINFNDKESLYKYLNDVYEKMSPQNLNKWKKEQEDFWKNEKPNATVTKEFFDVLAKGGWKCSTCDMPRNSNPQRRIQDLKDFGYTIATDLSRFCPKCQQKRSHRILLHIPRVHIAGNGYETWSSKLRKRIIDVLDSFDVFEGKKSLFLLPDHKFPEIRWDQNTKAENPDNMNDDEIRAKFQLLTNQRNQQKREVCRNCFHTGKRGTIYGFPPYFYEGGENWDENIPITGKEAEKGCIGCPWYDIQKWKEHYIEKRNIIISAPLNIDIISGLQKCTYLLRNDVLTVRVGNNIYSTSDENIITEFLSSDCKKSTDDAKAHYRYAMARNKELVNLKNDAAICGYLLNTSASDYTIEKLCAKYGVHFYSENGELADILSLDGLIAKLRSEIDHEGMTELLDKVEMPLTEVLASMEDAGIYINKQDVEDFGTYLSEMIAETQQMIYDDASHKFNISSPKQLGTVLFEEMGLPAKKKTKSGYSTNAEVLEELRICAPIVDNVLKYRQYTKLNSTYVVGLLDKIAPDGRIHTWFRQTETRTGRISSTEPNMQNIPVRTKLGAQMRKFFTAAEGKTLIDADYSQIELRVMAHLCGDENMIEAFNSGEDIHTSTAAQMFDMPLFMVTPEMRSAAKAVNFGIIYGIGAFSLAKDIGTSVAKAKKYIADYLAKYPKVNEFMESTVDNAFKDGYVTTMFGRKRRIPELSSSNKMLQAAGRRIAMNTPVQGTVADLIKIAMINVYNRLKAEKLDAKLILQVHDELIIESDISCADRCAELLKEEMQGVYDMRVPLAVDVHQGRNWYDAKQENSI